MRPVLLDPGVVDDPGGNGELGRHPFRAGAHKRGRIPGRVGQELLQRLVASRVLAKPKQRRLETLATAVLDQAADIKKRVLALPRQREPRHHLPDERDEPLARLRRRHLRYRCGFHLSSLQR
jgi:hypothetical protein